MAALALLSGITNASSLPLRVSWLRDASRRRTVNTTNIIRWPAYFILRWRREPIRRVLIADDAIVGMAIGHRSAIVMTPLLVNTDVAGAIGYCSILD